MTRMISNVETLLLALLIGSFFCSCDRDIERLGEQRSEGLEVPVVTLRTQGNTNSVNTDPDQEDKVTSLQLIISGGAITKKTYFTTEVQTPSAYITIYPFEGTRNAWFVANLPESTAYENNIETERVPTLERINPPFVMACHHSFLALTKKPSSGFQLENQIPYNTSTILPGIILTRAISRLDVKVSPEALNASTEGVRVDKLEVLNVPKYIELSQKATGTVAYLTPNEIDANVVAKKNFIRSNETLSYPMAAQSWEYSFDKIYLPENVAAAQDAETKVRITMSKASAPMDKKTFILSVGENQGSSGGAVRIGRNRYYKMNVTVKGWQYLSLNVSYTVEPWDTKNISLPAFE